MSASCQDKIQQSSVRTDEDIQSTCNQISEGSVDESCCLQNDVHPTSSKGKIELNGKNEVSGVRTICPLHQEQEDWVSAVASAQIDKEGKSESLNNLLKSMFQVRFQPGMDMHTAISAAAATELASLKNQRMLTLTELSTSESSGTKFGSTHKSDLVNCRSESKVTPLTFPRCGESETHTTKRLAMPPDKRTSLSLTIQDVDSPPPIPPIPVSPISEPPTPPAQSSVQDRRRPRRPEDPTLLVGQMHHAWEQYLELAENDPQKSLQINVKAKSKCGSVSQHSSDLRAKIKELRKQATASGDALRRMQKRTNILVCAHEVLLENIALMRRQLVGTEVVRRPREEKLKERLKRASIVSTAQGLGTVDDRIEARMHALHADAKSAAKN